MCNINLLSSDLLFNLYSRCISVFFEERKSPVDLVKCTLVEIDLETVPLTVEIVIT